MFFEFSGSNQKKKRKGKMAKRKEKNLEFHDYLEMVVYLDFNFIFHFVEGKSRKK